MSLDFKNATTRYLLKLLRECREDGIDLDNVNYCNALKNELATREHIPNKIEAKKIRQEKQKYKQNR